MSKKSPPRIIDLDIHGFSSNGYGTASFRKSEEQMAPVEIPFTYPGDIVTTEIIKKKKGLYSGKLLHVLKPAENRVEPKCVHFGYCGGCRWQHLSYKEQLIIKEKNLVKLFEPYLGPKTTIYPILACEPPWHYRNKMEFTFSNSIEKEHFLGLIKDSSKGRVFNVTECHLVNPWFVQTLEITRQWWQETNLEAYHPYRNTGSLRTLTLREGQRTGDKMIILTVSGNPDYAINRHQIDSFVGMLKAALINKDNDGEGNDGEGNDGEGDDAKDNVAREERLSIFLRIHQTAKGMKTQFYEMLLFGPDHIREQLFIKDCLDVEPYQLTFKISPMAFFQPNSFQAERLYSLSMQLLKIEKNEIVYDLYCGAGALGMCAGRKAQQIIGIEITPESVLDARANVMENDYSNITIKQGDVGKILDAEKDSLPKADIVMVDPPRAGLDQRSIDRIIDIHPKKILYISCNPKTQADNMKSFLERGYQLVALQPVDQFPHTIHLENIAILTA